MQRPSSPSTGLFVTCAALAAAAVCAAAAASMYSINARRNSDGILSIAARRRVEGVVFAMKQCRRGKPHPPAT